MWYEPWLDCCSLMAILTVLYALIWLGLGYLERRLRRPRNRSGRPGDAGS